MSANSVSSPWTTWFAKFKTQQYHRVLGSPSPELDFPEDEKHLLIPHDTHPSGTAVISFFLGFALAISITAISIYAHGPMSTPQQSQPPFSPDTKQTVSRENWSGAIYTPPPTELGRFAATKTSFLLAHDNTARKDWSAWVGLDVNTGLDNAFLRMGIDIAIESGSEPDFVAWYQWWPDVARQIPVLLRPGDLVAIEAVMFNETSAKVVIRNESRRSIMQQFLDAPVQGSKLRGHSAEWVVEIRDGDSRVGSLDVVLEKCVAYTDTGDMVVAEQGELVRGSAGVALHVLNATVMVTSQ